MLVRQALHHSAWVWISAILKWLLVVYVWKSFTWLHILVYVDDLIIASSSVQATESFKDYLCSCFHMKDLGELESFLGIEVARNAWAIYLCQRKYALDIINETWLLGAKPAQFPLEQNHKIPLSEYDMLHDATPYRRLLGRLIYLGVTRPDLSFSIHVLAQFMQNPRLDHWLAALRVVRTCITSSLFRS